MRISVARDGFRLRTEPIASIDDLIALIQRTNREFMAAMRWVSPRILIELLEVYNREMVAMFEGLDRMPRDRRSMGRRSGVS
jgi:hypothetical protein